MVRQLESGTTRLLVPAVQGTCRKFVDTNEPKYRCIYYGGKEESNRWVFSVLWKREKQIVREDVEAAGVYWCTSAGRLLYKAAAVCISPSWMTTQLRLFADRISTDVFKPYFWTDLLWLTIKCVWMYVTIFVFCNLCAWLSNASEWWSILTKLIFLIFMSERHVSLQIDLLNIVSSCLFDATVMRYFSVG